MTKFSYKISNKAGHLQTGQVEANSTQEAVEAIKKIGWYILSIKPQKFHSLNFPFWGGKERLSGIQLISFTDNLAAMIHSGTPLVEALEAYQEEDSKEISLVIESLIRNVRSGKKLSEGMAVFPKIFSPFYIALVQSGELTGNLDETLTYLGNELRREHEFYERIKSALMYPVIVLLTAFLVIILLVFLVIPKITQLTEALGGDLPLATKIVASVSVFISHYGPLIILLSIMALLALFASLKNKKTKDRLDPYLLGLPLFGSIIRKYILARFLRVIGNCLKYGIHLPISFQTVSEVVGNIRYQNACGRIEKRVTRGVSLSGALSQEETFLFPKIIVRSIRGAEKTGSVDVAMLRLSDFYETEVDRNLKRMTDLIEPLLTIVLGIVVGAIAISVIAPIYQLTSKIK